MLFRSPKSFYVGVRLEWIVDKDNKLNYTDTTNTIARIYGFIDRDNKAWKGPESFGEGPCMWVFLNELEPIAKMIDMFN